MKPGTRVLLGIQPGILLVSMAGSITDLPRAEIIDALATDRYRIQWVLGSNMVGAAAGMTWTGLALGWLGARRAYLLALILFGLGSLASSQMTETIWMAPARFLQGIGTGLTWTTAMMLVWRAHPVGRDRAMAWYGFGVYFAAIAGVCLGGWIASLLSWRWIFGMNLVLGAPALAIGAALLPKEPWPKEAGPRFDVVGFLLFLAWVIAMNFALDMGQYWGWFHSRQFLWWFLAWAGSFTAFIAWGVFHPHPLISLRPFGQRNFALGILLKAFLTIDLLVVTNLLSGYMIGSRGYQWRQAALAFVPALVCFVLALTATACRARPGTRKFRIASGLALMCMASFGLGALDLYTAKGTIAGWLALWGTGIGLAIAPILVVIFEGLSTEQTMQGAGIFNMDRALPAFAVAALLGTQLTWQTDSHYDRLRLRIADNRPIVAASTASVYAASQRSLGAGQSAENGRRVLAKWARANARAFARGDVLRSLALLTALALGFVPFVKGTPPAESTNQ